MADDNRENGSQERANYYQDKIEKYLKNFPSTFSEFVPSSEIVKFGNRLLSKGCSGYNFATSEQFPQTDKEDLIFYGMYAQRAWHLGALLSKMEAGNVIEENDVTFGVRASKIFIGKYKDEELKKSFVIMENGKKKFTGESVDGVIIFNPKSAEQARDVVDFLLTKAKKLKGAYSEPDIRVSATERLKSLFLESNILQLVIANLYGFDEGNIITLTPNKKIDEVDWKNEFNLINKDLYGYLTDPRLPIGQP